MGELYEVIMKGKICIEVVPSIPEWNLEDVGRIVYDKNSAALWVCTDKRNIGWITNSIIPHSITNRYIDWDIDLNDSFGLKVNATSVPCKYINMDSIVCRMECEPNSITNVQHAINDIRAFLELVPTAEVLEVGSIKRHHIDLITSEGINANDIYMKNRLLQFGPVGSRISIEDALNTYLIESRADKLRLSRPNTFGTKLNIPCHNVQEALTGIESYLDELTAIDIPIWVMPTNSCFTKVDQQMTNVQSAFDVLYQRLENRRIADLVDIQQQRKLGNVLKACCETSDCKHTAYWDPVRSSEVHALSSRITGDTNVQVILQDLEAQLAKIGGGEPCEVLQSTTDGELYWAPLSSMCITIPGRSGDQTLTEGIADIYQSIGDMAQDVEKNLNGVKANDLEIAALWNQMSSSGLPSGGSSCEVLQHNGTMAYWSELSPMCIEVPGPSGNQSLHVAVADIYQSLNDINHDIDINTSRIQSNDTEINALWNQISVNASDIDDLEAIIDGIEVGTDPDVTSAIAILTSRVDSMSSNINSLIMSVGELIGKAESNRIRITEVQDDIYTIRDYLGITL